MSEGELEALRRAIEELDGRLVALIAERVELARRVGTLKRGAGRGALDPGREAAVVRRAVGLGREAGLDEESVRRVFWNLIGLCRRAQQETT